MTARALPGFIEGCGAIRTVLHETTSMAFV
jgi:hypothetical protein